MIQDCLFQHTIGFPLKTRDTSFSFCFRFLSIVVGNSRKTRLGQGFFEEKRLKKRLNYIQVVKHNLSWGAFYFFLLPTDYL